MEEIKNEIQIILNSIDEVTSLFYQQKTEEGYLQLEDTLKTLSQGIDHIYKYQQVNNGVGIEEQQINQVLTQAMNAMVEKDTILLSDILQYDLKELFQSILEAF